jgi:hypothetical protein
MRGAPSEGSAGSGRRPLSPRQERVARRLLTQVGPGPEAFFRDACRLIADGSEWPSATHLVAHLLREIFSSLQSVLEPQGTETSAAPYGHRAKIQAILAGLGIPRDDLTSELWLSFAGQGNPDNLAAMAHRDGLSGPRPFGEGFKDYFGKAEWVLDAILESFEVNYFEVFGRLEELLTAEQPSDAHAHALRHRFPRTDAVTQHFFSRAPASWVSPLQRAAFFANPPVPQIAEDASSVHAPWPPSHFLARVAPDAPDAVVTAALTIPGTGNMRVNHDLVQIAVAVPASLSTRLVPQVVAALSSRYRLMIPQRAGALIVHLCRGGETGAALDLSAALLGELSDGYAPGATVHNYAYGVVLREHLPVLVADAGLRALGPLCLALSQVAARNRVHAQNDQSEDWSQLWRPSIHGHVEAPSTDLRHALIEAVRDSAIKIIESDLAPVAQVVAELGSYDRVIFRRMTLHILSQYPQHAPDLVRQQLTQAATLRDRRLHQEYLMLARKGTDCLNPSDLRRLLSLIDEGPTPAPRSSDGLTDAQPAPADPQDRDRIARWQRNCLAAIQVILPPEWDERYQALLTEFGPAPDPEEPIFVSFAWEAESSVTAGELAAMPTSALVSFLKTRHHSENDEGMPSAGAVRGVLSSAIQDDAEHRSADAASFIGLPADCISAVVDGLWQAQNHGATLDWDGVMTLSMWINQQASDEVARGHAEPGARLWHEPRIGMTRLLIAGLNLEPNPIPARLDGDIWSVIRDCCRDPDPTTQREHEPAAGPGNPYMSLALTAIRAQAVHAAISYALRIRRRTPEANLTRARGLLSRHLDINAEPSHAVRSVYGMHFSQLTWMDKDWAASHTDFIFPADRAQEKFLNTAWGAYLTVGQPTEDSWTLLVSIYSRMTDEMDLSSPEEENFPAAQLGRHLVRRFLAGQMSLESHDEILRRFYARISPSIMAQIMWWVSSGIEQSHAAHPDQVNRLITFWEYRVDDVKNGADPGELAAFGRWFATGVFDPVWSLRQLLTVLRLTGHVESEPATLTKLASLSTGHTQACLTVLEAWIDVARDGCSTLKWPHCSTLIWPHPGRIAAGL